MKVIITSEKPITSDDITSVMSYIKKEYEGSPINHMEIQYGDDASVLNVKKTAKGSLIFSEEAALSSEISEDDAFKAVLSKYESIQNRVATASEQEAIVSIVRNIGLPADVAAMMMDFCELMGLFTIQDIVCSAELWVEHDIVTTQKAEYTIAKTKKLRSIEDEFRRTTGYAFGFTLSQKEMLTTWIYTWKIEEALIYKAYAITLEQTGIAAFPYMNSIIKSWAENGIKTIKELNKAQKENRE